MTYNKNATRYYSSRQEKQIAKMIGGRTTSNSGASAFAAGDVESNNILIECKTCKTEKQSFAIKKEWLDKIEEESFSVNKQYCALAFNYGPNTDNYFILNERAFKQFLEFISTTENK